ncbi:peptidase inhibitor family I36 protein [Terrabacter sp. LjRoot27]|jgi:hypothetical protein|uniref:peptidase inhibitor family I36 protein n=1 Tax=Terrabacter sp. LjRoot27 TaxID=3342306 RepID=UPI003ED0AE6A
MTTPRRTVRRILAATLALSGVVAVTSATTGSASGSGTTCPTNRVCFYFNSDFGGARADYQYSDATMGNELFTDGPSGRSGWGVQVNDNAASVINHTGEYVWVFEGAGCSEGATPPYRLDPGEQVNLGAKNLKNKVSSFFVVDTGACIDRDQTWA